MDLNELAAGSTLYLPVFLKGGLIWTGDSHCRQGNGEVNLTALECAYKEIEIRPIVRKDLKTNGRGGNEDRLDLSWLRRGSESGDEDRPLSRPSIGSPVSRSSR